VTTITIEGGIYFDTGHDQYSGSQYKFLSGRFESWEKYIAIMPYTLAFDLPADFDPRTTQVQALEKQKADLHAKFALAVTEINARINSLLAIEGATSEKAKVPE
jgi:hypothetical protein